jgi:hypothetical protein
MVTSWLQPEAREVVADHCVAFAGRGLELSASQHSHAAIPTRDEPGLLQAAEHDRHGGTADAEHDRQEFVLQREIVRVHTVVHLQQPTAAALRDVVPRVIRLNCTLDYIRPPDWCNAIVTSLQPPSFR